MAFRKYPLHAPNSKSCELRTRSHPLTRAAWLLHSHYLAINMPSLHYTRGRDNSLVGSSLLSSSLFSPSMASSASSSLIFAISAFFFALSFSSVQSLTCISQKLPDKKVFANCTELPSLSATLHYSYNATNNSLSIAYVAAPAKPGGWVSWAINPTGQGMVGAQAIMAFKSNDTVVAKTYNLSSYKSIEESKLSFEVWDLSAIESDGVITILASVKVPGKPNELNQVWQVGPSVTNGRPDKHNFTPANLNAKSTLSVSTSTSAGENTTASTDKSGGVSATDNRFSLGLFAGLLILVASCVNF